MRMGVRRVVTRVGFVYVRGRRGATEQSDGLHFVVVRFHGRCRQVVFLPLHHRGTLREWQRIAMTKELRVDAEYERGVDGLARAADLGRMLVQRVEVVQDVVERALGDVFPFILSGCEGKKRREGG